MSSQRINSTTVYVRNRNRIGGTPYKNPDMKQFMTAIKDPFSPEAYGCKVCDSFTFPTVTSHVRFETQVTTSASGVGQVLMLPSPLLSQVNVAGTVSTGLTTFANNTFAYYPVSRSTLASTLDQYRVVAVGWKISNLQPELSATGRLIITPLPLGGTFPGWEVLNNSPTTAAWLVQATTGSPSGVLTSSAILNKPGTVEIAVQDLLHGSIQISMVPTSAVFYTFKNPGNANAYNTGVTIVENAEEVVNATTGAINFYSSEFTNSNDMTGGVGLNILIVGAPANSIALQIETVIHIEGTPYAQSGVALTESGAKACIGSTQMVETALNAANGNNFMTWINRGAQFLSAAYQNTDRRTMEMLARGGYALYNSFGRNAGRRMIGM